MKRAVLSLLAGVAVLAVHGCARHGTTSPEAAPSATTEKTRIDLELVDASIYDAVSEVATKARINVSLDSAVAGKVTISVRSKPWDEVLQTIADDHGLEIHEMTTPKGSVFRIVPATGNVQPTGFTGAPITAAFEDVPIREVARKIAELAGVEIVVDDDVQASVTQYLRNTPWDLALVHIAGKYELRVVRDDQVVRIRKRDKATAE